MDVAIPWRKAALVASAVAALELVGLLAVGTIALARPLAHRRTQASAAISTTTRHVHKLRAVRVPIVPHLTRSRIRVLVLNGNGLTGAAGAEAATLRLHGYRIAATGNAKRTDYATSLVMYRPGYVFEARRLARDARIGVVGPLDGLRIRDLRGSQLVVVVGR
jgi:hypothetical protein